MEDQQIYYSLAIHPRQINVSYRSLLPSKSSGQITRIPKQFENNKHQGRISPAARRKIFRRVDYITHLACPKRHLSHPHGRYFTLLLAFFTLTLSSKQIHSDAELMRRLIHPFITDMKRKWNVKMYLWRGEHQENGNIHFHFIVPNFIPWRELRDTWNRIQQNLGYITRFRDAQHLRYKNGFRFDPAQFPKVSYNQQKINYRNGIESNWDNPNSTDIHSVQYVGNVTAYLCKYISKADQSGQMTSRLWGCSHNLSHLEGGQDDVDYRYQEEFSRIRESKKARIYSEDWFTIFYIDQALLNKLGCVLLLACFDKFIQERFPNRSP